MCVCVCVYVFSPFFVCVFPCVCVKRGTDREHNCQKRARKRKRKRESKRERWRERKRKRKTEREREIEMVCGKNNFYTRLLAVNLVLSFSMIFKANILRLANL